MAATLATITFSIQIDAPLSEPVLDAIYSLASVMEVQAEDGLYSDGNPDEGDHVADISSIFTHVTTQEV